MSRRRAHVRRCLAGLSGPGVRSAASSSSDEELSTTKSELVEQVAGRAGRRTARPPGRSRRRWPRSRPSWPPAARSRSPASGASRSPRAAPARRATRAPANRSRSRPAARRASPPAANSSAPSRPPSLAAELRAAVDALLAQAQSWRPPPRDVDDGPPAPDELLLIVLRCKRSPNTRRLYARELALFLAFCRRREQPVYAVRAEHVEDYLALEHVTGAVARTGRQRPRRGLARRRAGRDLRLLPPSRARGRDRREPVRRRAAPDPPPRRRTRRARSRATRPRRCSARRAVARRCTSCSSACCSSTACAPARRPPRTLRTRPSTTATASCALGKGESEHHRDRVLGR